MADYNDVPGLTFSDIMRAKQLQGLPENDPMNRLPGSSDFVSPGDIKLGSPGFEFKNGLNSMSKPRFSDAQKAELSKLNDRTIFDLIKQNNSGYDEYGRAFGSGVQDHFESSRAREEKAFNDYILERQAEEQALLNRLR